ncbi:MAG: hypothetical protein A2W85_07175 [Bacteroidetes bacterium GWF2_41_31]|nr:MAG: hypothetical protein A2W85_07175 [Bacteroidetes bacterium GWF2_41_31]OFZ09284.1 MAG: hypothetical protein A2338_03630 [Bacteroidetes bacterium RIFOXYB12_FULL_41_6]
MAKKIFNLPEYSNLFFVILAGYKSTIKQINSPMKKIRLSYVISLLLAFVCTPSLLAQDSGKAEYTEGKTEFNIGVANIFAKNNTFYPIYYIDQYGNFIYDINYIFSVQQPELVVGLKFHQPKGAFRLGTNMSYSSTTDEQKSGSKEKTSLKLFSEKFFVGYEWHVTYSRIKIFYGFDVSTSYASLKMEQEYPVNNGYQNNSSTKYNEFAVGINPLLGVDLMITPHLSIGTEIKYSTEYVTGKSETKYGTNSSDKTNSSAFRTYFGPLGYLSVNIYF